MEYKISAVSPTTRTYPTKFGDMVSYKVKFEGSDTVVEVGQKSSTPAPTVGQTMNGTIDMSSQYGPKFKKEYNQGGGFGSSPQTSGVPTSSAGTGSNKFQSDPFTMYLSYAKDVAVALIGSKEGFNQEKFASVLEDVMTGGKTLYEARPGAEDAAKPAEEPKAKDNLPDDTFDGSEPVSLDEIPF